MAFSLRMCKKIKYLGVTISQNGRMTNVSYQMARNFAGAITRVKRIYLRVWYLKGSGTGSIPCSGIFEVFSLSAGLNGCQVWATNNLKSKFSTKSKAHNRHICLLKMLLV